MEENQVRNFRMVVIGGSAGSLEIMLDIISSLSGKINASFIIVLHRMQTQDSLLQELVSSKTSMTVREAEDKELIQPGWIYLAPADYHLLIENEMLLSLDTSEPVNYCRPSIDVTFESAAEIYGSSLIGVVLSGANADGARGLANISSVGGYTIVQDPATAEVAFMPAEAIRSTKADAVIPGKDIGTLLNALLSTK